MTADIFLVQRGSTVGRNPRGIIVNSVARVHTAA